MKQVKYRVWAILLQLILGLGIFFTMLAFTFSVVGELFKLDKDFGIPSFQYGYRNYKYGYPVKATMYLDIPKKVELTKSEKVNINLNGQSIQKDTTIITDTILNQFTTDPVKHETVDHEISVPEKVNIRVKTDSQFHRWYYILYDHLDRLFYALIFFWLIGLINRYLRSDFLNAKSFKVIARIGYAFICMNVIKLGFMVMLPSILPRFSLVSNSVSLNQPLQVVDIRLSSGISIQCDYIIIGIAILILSDIIKNAVLIKRDQDLTI